MIRRTELLRALKKVVSDKAPIAGSTLLLLILGTISCSDSGKCEDYLRNRGLDDSWKGLELAVERNDRLGVDCLMDSGHHPWNPIWYGNMCCPGGPVLYSSSNLSMLSGKPFLT